MPQISVACGVGQCQMPIASAWATRRGRRPWHVQKLLRVVAFATHGLLPREAEGVGEAALVLSPPAKGSAEDDGLLTASEVAGLDLDADWVILSACNTASGDKAGAEALSGLARAFFYAGERSLLVSHWPVNSWAAVLLTTRAMREFERDLAVGKADPECRS